MAAGTWNFFVRCKEKLGLATFDFSARALRITLHSIGASVNLSAANDMTAISEVGSELSAARGYLANGKTISGGLWTISATDAVYKGVTGVFWSADGGFLGTGTIKYALLHASLAGGSRFPLAWVTLSSTPFQVADASRLTINNGGGDYFKIQ